MRKKQVTVRLSDAEMAKVEVLALGGSREGWFRNLIEPAALRRVTINDGAISEFRMAARKAVDDAKAAPGTEEALDARKRAEEYRKLISEYEAEIAILYKRA